MEPVRGSAYTWKMAPRTGAPGWASWSDDGAGDDLGEAESVCAGHRRRRRRTQRRHAHEAHRHAGLGEDERRLDAVAVEDEGRDGADQVGQDGPGAQRLAAAGHDLGHLDRVARVPLALHHALQVLDGVVPAGVELVKLGRLSAVAGAHRGPPEADRAEVVLHARDLGDVGLCREPALAGRPVDDLDAAAVGRAVGVAARQVEVAGAVARAEPERARRRGQRARDELGRQPRRLARAVDHGAALGEQTQRVGGEDLHAGPLEDLERRPRQAIELLRCVHGEGEIAAQWRQRLAAQLLLRSLRHIVRLWLGHLLKAPAVGPRREGV